LITKKKRQNELYITKEKKFYKSKESNNNRETEKIFTSNAAAYFLAKDSK